ncbi:hypothetical protein Tco_0659009 [Tanacetum coccineum]
MTESPLVDSGFDVPVFSPGDDPIAYLNKAMAFLTVVASLRFLRTQYKLREILLESKETKNYYSGWQSHCATSHGRQVSIVIWYWIIRVIATSSGGKCNAVQEGYQNPFHLKKVQRIKSTLYDGIVMSDKHVAMPVIDDEETEGDLTIK